MTVGTWIEMGRFWVCSDGPLPIVRVESLWSIKKLRRIRVLSMELGQQADDYASRCHAAVYNRESVTAVINFVCMDLPATAEFTICMFALLTQ